MTAVTFCRLSLLALAAIGCSSCPRSCSCQRAQVSCSGDGVEPMPSRFPSTATRLLVRNYAIPVVQANSFQDLTNLTELTVAQGEVSSVDCAALIHLSALTHLDLSQNRIQHLPEGSFASLRQLTSLDLSSNRLVECPGAFRGLSSLEQLVLRDNKIHAINSACFSSMAQLKYLNIAANNLTSIPKGTLSGLEKLERLILADNPLVAMDHSQLLGSSLQYMDMSGTGLQTLPQTMSQHVVDIRMSRARLKTLQQGDLDSFPHLEVLVLDSNHIADVEEDTLGRHERLIYLSLRSNQLETVPKQLPSNLKTLLLDNNHIESIQTRSLQSCSSLETLSLKGNRIKEIDKCAFCGTQLKELNLQQNRLQYLQVGILDGLGRLEKLQLSANPIQAIDEMYLSPLSSLTSLSLSNIHEEVSLPESAFDSAGHLTVLDISQSPSLIQQIFKSNQLLTALRNLQRLDIRGNRLTQLPSDWPTLLPHLKTLWLGGTNWDCSKPNVQWIFEWIIHRSITFEEPNQARCKEPEEMKMKPLMALEQSDYHQTASPRTDTSNNIQGNIENGEPIDSKVKINDTVHINGEELLREKESHEEEALDTATVNTQRRTDKHQKHLTAHRDEKQPTNNFNPNEQRRVIAQRSVEKRINQSMSFNSSELSPEAAAKVDEDDTTKTKLFNNSKKTDKPLTNLATYMAYSRIMRKLKGRLPKVDLEANQPFQKSSRFGLGDQSLHGWPSYAFHNDNGTLLALLTSLLAAIGFVMLVITGAACLWHYRNGAIHPFRGRQNPTSFSHSRNNTQWRELEETGLDPSSCGMETVPLETLAPPGSEQHFGGPVVEPLELTSDRQELLAGQAWHTPSPTESTAGEGRW